MTRLSEGQASGLLVVLLVGALWVAHALWVSLRRDQQRGPLEEPSVWERHEARMALWFGEGEPLSPRAQAHLAVLQARRTLRSVHTVDDLR